MKDSFKIKDYYLDTNRHEATIESWEYSDWTIHEESNFYLVCGPKLMSSWAHGKFRKFSNIKFQTSDLSIFNIQSDDVLHKKTIMDDWEKIRIGENSSKPFIFIMRNPTQKLLSGLIQDTVFNYYPNDGTFKDHFDNPQHKEFKEDYKKLMVSKGYSESLIEEFMNSNIYTDAYLIEEKYLRIYQDTLMIPVDWYFDCGTPSWRTHMNMDIFILHKMMFHADHSKCRRFNTNMIRIVDMDKECVGTVINKLNGKEKRYNYKEVAEGVERGNRDSGNSSDEFLYGKPGYLKDHNIKTKLMKFSIFEKIFGNDEYLSKIKFLNSGREYCWFELMNKLYPLHMYDKALGIEKKPFSAYKDTYGITEYENLKGVEVDMYDATTYTHFHKYFHCDLQSFIK